MKTPITELEAIFRRSTRSLEPISQIAAKIRAEAVQSVLQGINCSQKKAGKKPAQN